MIVREVFVKLVLHDEKTDINEIVDKILDIDGIDVISIDMHMEM